MMTDYLCSWSLTCFLLVPYIQICTIRPLCSELWSHGKSGYRLRLNTSSGPCDPCEILPPHAIPRRPSRWRTDQRHASSPPCRSHRPLDPPRPEQRQPKPVPARLTAAEARPAPSGPQVCGGRGNRCRQHRSGFSRRLPLAAVVGKGEGRG
jgi:hypothetical protein